MGQWLVEGRGAGEVADWLGGLAAVTDQSDAWAGLRLAGDAAREVLARLVPLDLGPGLSRRARQRAACCGTCRSS